MGKEANKILFSHFLAQFFSIVFVVVILRFWLTSLFSVFDTSTYPIISGLLIGLYCSWKERKTHIALFNTTMVLCMVIVHVIASLFGWAIIMNL